MTKRYNILTDGCQWMTDYSEEGQANRPTDFDHRFEREKI